MPFELKAKKISTNSQEPLKKDSIVHQKVSVVSLNMNGTDNRAKHMSTTPVYKKHQFTFLVLLFHVVFMILYGIFGRFTPNALPGGDESKEYVNSKYPLYQDVHVMIFIGFGFLMVFLRRYGFASVSINMLLACFTIEWGILVRGFTSEEFLKDKVFTISIDQILTADFAAAVVLITMGSLLGKLSPAQYLIMAFLEVPAALITEHFIVHGLHVNDVGGSIIVHAFGAYFGLAASRVLYRKYWDNHEHAGSIYHSDLMSMVGALFLWVYWPSFNAVVAEPEDARQRAIINTLLSLVACTLTTFLVSQLVNKHRHFDMVHIANSTLAGGVAIGTTANVVLNPVHALLVGTVAGALSVVGYEYITPWLDHKLQIQDTCGVNNLHGMPGVLAGLFGVFFAVWYDPARYGASLNTIYPAFKPYDKLEDPTVGGRTAIDQALFQLAGVGLSVGVAIVTGAITGLILRLPFWNQVREKELYSDGDYFHVPDDYDFTTRVTSNIDHVELTETHETTKLTS
uniref:Ammonium transporter AmtB-like domain-containing protein n=1 Tax=Acrobeloides nanus TaxID=290746 RepID=A0A914C273_9BILA